MKPKNTGDRFVCIDERGRSETGIFFLLALQIPYFVIRKTVVILLYINPAHTACLKNSVTNVFQIILFCECYENVYTLNDG
jgi:hypothetical protein